MLLCERQDVGGDDAPLQPDGYATGPPSGDAQQRRPSLSVVRMALLGGGNENCRIEENIHWLCFQNGLNPLIAHSLKHTLPVCRRFRAALMNPQTIDVDHGRPLFDPLETHALRLL